MQSNIFHWTLTAIALTEVIQYASVMLGEEGVADDNRMKSLIVAALKWLKEEGYISYDGRMAQCNEKYL